jgi:hypothetical protein
MPRSGRVDDAAATRRGRLAVAAVEAFRWRCGQRMASASWVRCRCICDQFRRSIDAVFGPLRPAPEAFVHEAASVAEARVGGQPFSIAPACSGGHGQRGNALVFEGLVQLFDQGGFLAEPSSGSAADQGPAQASCSSLSRSTKRAIRAISRSVIAAMSGIRLRGGCY